MFTRLMTSKVHLTKNKTTKYERKNNIFYDFIKSLDTIILKLIRGIVSREPLDIKTLESIAVKSKITKINVIFLQQSTRNVM